MHLCNTLMWWWVDKESGSITCLICWYILWKTKIACTHLTGDTAETALKVTAAAVHKSSQLEIRRSVQNNSNDTIDFMWRFNSIFHLVQIYILILLYYELFASLKSVLAYFILLLLISLLNLNIIFTLYFKLH